MQFTQPNRKRKSGLLLLAAILCNVCAALHWLHLIPVAIIGALIPRVCVPKATRRPAVWVLAGLFGAFTLIRFLSILDGMKLLANRMFYLSEQTQAYAYDYFATAGHSAVEAVLWVSILMGALCVLWENRASGVLCGLWMIAMAYFGVTPAAGWLALLVLAALFCALPGRWFYRIVAAVLVAVIAVAAAQIAPEPSRAVSALDDHLRDALAAAPIVYEQTPVPTEVPEPELIPPPSIQTEQPDHGVQNAAINVLFIVLALLTLAILFIPALIKDRAAKLREKNRAGIYDEDNAAAIKAMYLYTARLRKLSSAPGGIPAEVYAVWQEAAYSDHAMTAEQRKIVHDYMAQTAKTVWEGSNFRQRFAIRYRIGL